MRFLSRTPVRTFLLYPFVTVIWELIIHAGRIEINPWFLPFMVWGYLQYRLCGSYRGLRGGGGPGPEVPRREIGGHRSLLLQPQPDVPRPHHFSDRIALTMHSWLAALITVAVAVWFHFRIFADERNLAAKLGQPYVTYTRSVKRWIPGLF